MLFRSMCVALCATLGLVSAAVAQQEAPEAAPPEAPAPVARPLVAARANANAGALDEQIATCLTLSTRNEIEICKFAKGRLQSQEAKDFAQMMIEQHTAALAKLEKFAGENANARPAAGVNGEPRPAAGATVEPRRPGIAVARPGVQVEIGRGGIEVDTGAAANVNAQNVAAQWQQIGHEMAAECLASQKAELEKAKPEDVDKCFIGMQLAGHMHMVTELTVYSRHTSANLSGELRANLEVAQKHEQQAKAVMETLKAAHHAAPTTGAVPSTNVPPKPAVEPAREENK